MAPVHERFDLARWIAEFPLAAARAEARAFVEERARNLPGEYDGIGAIDDHIALMSPHGEIIQGPADMALTEQLRQEAGGLDGAGPRVPVDLMVWGDGEPAHGAATKLGGVPHRPRGAPWPVDGRGRPARFLGQICFADSRDLVGAELPGDVLLLFETTPERVFEDDDENDAALRWEWQPLALADRATAASLPPLPEGYAPVRPCHAQLHRTFDLPAVPEAHALHEIRSSWLVRVLQGGKIGGVPSYVQAEAPRPGRFLAALGSVQATGERWPLVNVPASDDPFGLRSDYPMFGDAGSLYLLLDRLRLRWAVQGY